MKILVVDDSRVMRSLVIRSLKVLGFSELGEAGTGVEALVALRAAPHDLVLADWNMPEMDGLSLLRTLRQEGPAVPLGFVTSECTQDMIHKATSEGALFVVNKPFTTESLGSALRGAFPGLAA